MLVNRRTDGQTDRQEDTNTERHLEANSRCSKFRERKIYECRASTEIFRSNIDKVFEKEKLEETNNRKLLSIYLNLLLN